MLNVSVLNVSVLNVSVFNVSVLNASVLNVSVLNASVLNVYVLNVSVLIGDSCAFTDGDGSYEIGFYCFKQVNIFRASALNFVPVKQYR